jgi:hypothetical protein
MERYKLLAAVSAKGCEAIWLKNRINGITIENPSDG